MNRFKSYLLVVLAGLVLLAVVILVILQWGNYSAFSLYGKSYGKNEPGGVNTGLIMVICILAGPVLLWLTKVLIGNSLNIYRARRVDRKATQQSQQMAEHVLEQVGQAGQDDQEQ